MNATLGNICMIEDAQGRVLVQHRLPKPTNPWCGLTFPGWHINFGESIMASTVREIKEETGLEVLRLRLCGIVEWEVPEKPKSTVWQDNIPVRSILFLCSEPAPSPANSALQPKAGWNG